MFKYHTEMFQIFNRTKQISYVLSSHLIYMEM